MISLKNILTVTCIQVLAFTALADSKDAQISRLLTLGTQLEVSQNRAPEATETHQDYLDVDQLNVNTYDVTYFVKNDVCKAYVYNANGLDLNAGDKFVLNSTHTFAGDMVLVYKEATASASVKAKFLNVVCKLNKDVNSVNELEHSLENVFTTSK